MTNSSQKNNNSSPSSQEDNDKTLYGCALIFSIAVFILGGAFCLGAYSVYKESQKQNSETQHPIKADENLPATPPSDSTSSSEE